VHPRPYAFVNLAMTADGKIDTVERRGARISGASDTARVYRLRAEADAIMVGGHTLLAEDPRLTVRDPALCAERVARGRPEQPTKVGIVSRVSGPGDDDSLRPGQRFLHEGGGRVVVCTSKRTPAAAIDWLRQQDVEVVIRGHDRVDLPAALTALAEKGVERLMVEGGSTLVAALLEAQLVDELQLAIAPVIFGGETAPTPVGGDGWPVEHARRLKLIEATTSADGDVILRYAVGEDPNE
jgi:2,5-diamino-6-(ribosylamino)-4(3H)-pyrimidinone 5'-phosphate reductase